MSSFSRGKKLLRVLSLIATLGLGINAATAQQSTAGLHGHVSDERGGMIVGAKLILFGENTKKTTASDSEGKYSFVDLVPGRYILRASAVGFETYEKADVTLAARRSEQVDVLLKVAVVKESITVPLEGALRPDPDSNANAIVVRGEQLDALPDDPDQLVAALQALAGVSGPDGGQIYIDGFAGGRNPPKGSIREVRINQNPFSAEFDRPGFGRVEILTKAGASKFSGDTFLTFNDESLNSRNPFAPNRPPFQYRLFGGDLGGPLGSKHSSFFMDFERREVDDSAVINAIVLDPQLKATTLAQVTPTPRRRTTLGARIDDQLNKNHTLIGRYTYTRTDVNNLGVGDFALPSRAFNSHTTQETVQLSETAIINNGMINEARFQYVHDSQQLNGEGSGPSIIVLDSFSGGASPVGRSKSIRYRYELGDNLTLAPGKHTVRIGARLRSIRITDQSPYNYGGTVTFAGGSAPQLDANNHIVVDTNGQPFILPISSIERYRRTLFFQAQGKTKPEIRILGGGATQFSIAAGNPEAQVHQIDLGVFIQDDWRISPNFTLGLGVRYEVQTNVKSHFNFGPRLAFGWSPATKSQAGSRTVIRGAFAIFYSPVSEDLTLQSHRLNGFNQQQFIVTDPIALDSLSGMPTPSELSTFTQAQTIKRLAQDLRSPYTIQSTISLERQLPGQLKLSVAYINARVLHVLRTRNINAPLLTAPGTSNHPLGNIGNVYEYESSGVFNQNQLIAILSGRLSPKISLNAIYTLSKTKSDTDGVNTFPAYSYDLSTEYGRYSADIRHRFFLTGSATLPWGIRLSPLIGAASGRPFNITTGRDTNSDTVFAERPAFATVLNKPGVVVTPWGAFDLNPLPGEKIIPRNYGNGPGFFALSVRLSKSFRFGVGEQNRSALAAPVSQRTSSGNSALSRRIEKKYTLTFSVQVWNLFNRANLNTPIGNVSSPFFGRANSIAGTFGTGDPQSGSRLIELQTRFSF